MVAPNSERKRQLSVSFTDEEKTVHIITDQYEDVSHKKDLWYNKKDYYAFRQRDFFMSQCIKKKYYANPNAIESRLPNQSIRGLLEYKSEACKSIRQSCSSIVLSGPSAFQSLQHHFPQLMYLVTPSSTKDQDIIAQVYSLATVSSVQKAIERAASDKKFVDEHIVPPNSTFASILNLKREEVEEQLEGNTSTFSLPSPLDGTYLNGADVPVKPSSTKKPSVSTRTIMSFDQISRILFCSSFDLVAAAG